MGGSAALTEGTLTVASFGGFGISVLADGKITGPVLPGNDSHARKVWSLVEYLIFCGHSVVPAEELIGILWPGDDEVSDPVRSLRLLIHRARAELAKLPCGDADLICCTGGAYSWNRSLPMEIDADLFEQRSRAAEAETSSTGRLGLLESALSLYRGHFLPKEAAVPWVMSVSAYYHNRYVAMCLQAAELLLTLDRPQEGAGICAAALVQDPFVDQLHTALIRCLAASGDIRGAKEHYRKAAALFRDELGVDPSPGLTGAYRDAVNQENMPRADMKTIRSALLPKEEPGAFCCEYDFFRRLYSLKQRECARQKYEVQLALITAEPGARASERSARAVMDCLSATIRSSLRQGDVYTRFSASQYLLLLQFTTTEKGGIALRRIRSNFRKAMPSSGYLLKCSLLPVLPEHQERQDPPAAETGV